MRVPPYLVLTFVLLASAIGAGVWIYGLERERRVLANRTEGLLGVADLKVSQIAHWRRERIGDVRLAAGSTDLKRRLERHLLDPSNRENEATILEWFGALRDNYHYEDVVLCDAQGAARIALKPSPGGGFCGEIASQAIRRNSEFASDFLRTSEGRFRLVFAAPVLGGRATPVGALLLVCDPDDYLFPLMRIWPPPGETSETLLVERRGNNVLYLSGSRHRVSATLSRELPLSRTDRLAVQAVMGREGGVSGVDYRGVKVLGAARRVPDTPWYVLAKVDRTEALASLRTAHWMVLLIFSLLVVSAAFAVILFWRQQQLRFYREQHAATAEVERVNRALRMLTSCEEALIRTTEETPLYEELCRVAVEVGGYKLAWVGLAEQDEAKRVRLAAKTGVDSGFLQTGGITWADEPRGRSPMGTAIRTGRMAVVRGTLELEHEPFRQFADLHGIVAGVGLPLRVEGVVVGALAVYSGETESFDTREIAILTALSEDVSFGVQSIRRRDSQRAAEKALQQREEQLRQWQKLESIGRLAGSVAHDFNNYLAVIDGYCDAILTDLPPDDPLRRPVSEIRRSGERAAQLTRQLLAFSRKQPLDLRHTSLAEVLKDSEGMLRRLAGEGVEVALEWAPDLWPIMADPVQMQQVLMNLAANARDAMPGGGRLTVRASNFVGKQDAAAPGTQPEEHVLLSVQDTGTGMDEETRSRLFEPFFTTKEPGHGTGLGLSTVYGIVRQSGGWISVESQAGKGTTFLIRFPRSDANPLQFGHTA